MGTGRFLMRQCVWSGHPSITPMIWSICEDLQVDYANSVVLGQSLFFKDRFPEENARFGNVVFTDAVNGDRESSLAAMRAAMLSRDDLMAAVLIGGMEGVEAELACSSSSTRVVPWCPWLRRAALRETSLSAVRAGNMSILKTSTLPACFIRRLAANWRAIARQSTLPETCSRDRHSNQESRSGMPP